MLTVEVEPLDQAASVRRDYYAALADALRRLPEVVSAGAIDQLALDGGGIYGFPTADTGVNVEGPQRTVLPGYLEAMGVRAARGPSLRGRRSRDRRGGRRQRRRVPAVLRRQRDRSHAAPGGKNPRQLRIVGVVPNIRHSGPQGVCEPEMYVLPDPNAADAASLQLAMVMRLRGGRVAAARSAEADGRGDGPARARRPGQAGGGGGQ